MERRVSYLTNGPSVGNVKAYECYYNSGYWNNDEALISLIFYGELIINGIEVQQSKMPLGIEWPESLSFAGKELLSQAEEVIEKVMVDMKERCKKGG
jgi:hypothetical protein